MPQLRFEVTESLDDAEVASFADWVTERYAEHMATGTGHVGVSVRDDAAITMGRADPDEPVAFLDADIRAGRSTDQRRGFAVAIMDELHDRWAIPTENCYVVYTEHPGADFHLREGALTSWETDETADESGPVDPA
jgi:5-carboxymethyl-2-hydroxymuconate isomerase